MAFFKLKKRCAYCGSVLDAQGNCPNTACINHQDTADNKAEEDASKKEG